MKLRIKNYLSVTKKEWNGMVVLVFLIALTLVAPYAYKLWRKDSIIINAKDFDKAIAQLGKAGAVSAVADGDSISDAKIAYGALFDFNPNNLPASKWKALGLGDKQISIILHFEAKGGHFYKNTDLKKIYGITPADYARLEPYIDIPDSGYVSNKIQAGTTIELNTADSAKLTRVRGIGPSFAMRIIRYRDRLGGFYREEQLKEVFGVDSVKYAAIKDQLTINAAKVTRISINQVSFNALLQFPYLSYKQVNAIIQYRAQHSNYKSISDIENIEIISPQDLRKIEPYLSYK